MALCALSAATQASQLSAKAPDLLFVSNQDGDREVFTVSQDASTLRQLTHNDRDDYQASWSPDGSRIAFTSARDGGNPEIYIMNADGSDQVNVTRHKRADYSPQWSPDSTQLVFCSDRSGALNLYLINADGSNLRQLTKGTMEDGEHADPQWSPDGKWIGFRLLNWRQKADLVIIKPDGLGQQNITANEEHDELTFTWAPDSREVAYTSRRQRIVNVYKKTIMEDSEVQLTDLDTIDANPRWSGSGKEIAFLSSRDDGIRAEVYVMAADGSSQRPLTSGRHEEMDVSWSQDDKFIYHSSFRTSNSAHVFRTALKGDNSTHIHPATSGYQLQALARPDTGQ